MTAQRLSGFPLLISIRGACHRNLTFDIRGAALFERARALSKGSTPVGLKNVLSRYMEKHSTLTLESAVKRITFRC